jgi:hypothetical protein
MRLRGLGAAACAAAQSKSVVGTACDAFDLFQRAHAPRGKNLVNG